MSLRDELIEVLEGAIFARRREEYRVMATAAFDAILARLREPDAEMLREAAGVRFALDDGGAYSLSSGEITELLQAALSTLEPKT